jgi:hypothetical protein
MKKKVVALMLLVTIVGTSLVGCGAKANSDEEASPYDSMSKKELLASCKELESELDEAYSDYDELQSAVTGAGLISDNLPNITDIGDGTNRLTFQTVDDVITFNSDFVYPESTEAANTSDVEVSENLSFKPYENWYIQQKGSTTELYHLANISGKVSIGNIENSSGMYYVTEEENSNYGWNDTSLTPEIIKERVVGPWLKGLANVGDIQYSELYLDTTVVGIQAKTTTLVDGQEAHIKVGMFDTRRGEACQYVFLYEGAYDSLKEEHEDLLIHSFQVGENKLLVD